MGALTLLPLLPGRHLLTKSSPQLVWEHGLSPGPAPHHPTSPRCSPPLKVSCAQGETSAAPPKPLSPRAPEGDVELGPKLLWAPWES